MKFLNSVSDLKIGAPSPNLLIKKMQPCHYKCKCGIFLKDNKHSQVSRKKLEGHSDPESEKWERGKLLRPIEIEVAARRELGSPTGRQNTSKPISEAKKNSIEEGLDSVTD